MRKILERGSIFIMVLAFILNITTYGQKAEMDEDLTAKIRIEKYRGERLDIPTPEEREDLNLLVSIEEREIMPGGLVQIFDKEDRLIRDDIEIGPDGVGELELPVGEYRLVDKKTEEGYRKDSYDFVVRDHHLERGLVIESYNPKSEKLEDQEEGEEILVEDVKEEASSSLAKEEKEEAQLEGESEKLVEASKETSDNPESADRMLEKEEAKLPRTGSSSGLLSLANLLLLLGFGLARD